MAKDIYDELANTKQSINQNNQKLQQCDTVFERGEATEADEKEEIFLENQREILKDDYSQLKIKSVEKIVGEKFQDKLDNLTELVLNLANNKLKNSNQQ